MSETIQPDDRTPIVMVQARAIVTPEGRYLMFEANTIQGRLTLRGGVLNEAEHDDPVTAMFSVSKPPRFENGQRLPTRAA